MKIKVDLIGLSNIRSWKEKCPIILSIRSWKVKSTIILSTRSCIQSWKKSKKNDWKQILAESLRSGLNLYDNCRWINDLDSYHTIIDRKNTILTYKNDHLRKVYNYLRNVCWFDNQIRSLIWKYIRSMCVRSVYTIQRDFLKVSTP